MLSWEHGSRVAVGVATCRLREVIQAGWCAIFVQS
jgi:hypothetical protein